MVIKANSLNNAATKYLAHCQYQDNKNYPKFVQTAKYCSVHFHFPLRNLPPQTCGLIYKFHEEMHGH